MSGRLRRAIPADVPEMTRVRTPLRLTTEPGTRAERFYRAAGWRPCGATEHGEIRMELRPSAAPRAV